MPRRRTVLLEHLTPTGRHFDWCVEHPAHPAGAAPLVTFRVTLASWAWAAAGRLTLERIGDHRRAYLDYQGPIAGKRGRVRRVDAGQVLVRRWGASRAVLDVALGRFTGTVELRRLDSDRWAMVALAAAGRRGTMSAPAQVTRSFRSTQRR